MDNQAWQRLAVGIEAEACNIDRQSSPESGCSHRKRICDVQPEDTEFLRKFEEEIDMLTGMVDEMFVKTPQVLLSPVMRRLLIDKAKKVAAMRTQVLHRLVIDNPGKPLTV